MLEDAQQQLVELKQLLKTPTTENFEVANQKLSGVFMALQSFAAQPPAVQMPSAGDRAFLSRLPSEMAHVLRLFKGPVEYLEGLARLRAQKFGSYNRDGQIKGLGQEGCSRTITHL